MTTTGNSNLLPTRTLQVLMIATRYFPYMGGVETHVFEVAPRVARMGIQVTVLSSDLSGNLPRSERVDAVRLRRVRAWPAERDYYFAPGIYPAVTRGDWDIVHCQGYHTLVPPLAMLAAVRARIPYVVTFHSGGHSSPSRTRLRRLQHALLRPLLARASRLIAVSHFEAELFQRQLHLPAQRFVVIPNGAQLPTSIASVREGTGEKLIVSVGRLERYKGHHRIIAALPKILEQCPDVRLRIAGSGPYESALKQLAHDLGIADWVEIRAVPSMDRMGMAQLLSQAALMVLLSSYESQGIAVMEALAVGCPVLVTDTSALQEVVERGLARAIPLTSTTEEVVAAVIGQLRQPLVPPRIDLPTWEACAAQLATVYRTVTQEAQAKS